ncbi:MAG: hypothetical protein PHP64_06505 [Actinomycetota bacterium]|nr:hypothetical protein [Actinomycetota bacterium]
MKIVEEAQKIHESALCGSEYQLEYASDGSAYRIMKKRVRGFEPAYTSRLAFEQTENMQAEILQNLRRRYDG